MQFDNTQFEFVAIAGQAAPVAMKASTVRSQKMADSEKLVDITNPVCSKTHRALQKVSSYVGMFR